MKSLFVGTLGLMLGATAAYAQTSNSVCNANPLRETLIYIDDSDMAESYSLWPLTLAVKLSSSLMPGEPVTIDKVSPATGSVTNVWQGCWPGLVKSVSSNLDEDEVEFSDQVNTALVSIYSENVKSDSEIAIDPHNAPVKNIVLPIFTDVHNHTDKKHTVRVIVYSDLAENNKRGSVFSPKVPGLTYRINIVGSVFYIFGEGQNIVNDPDYDDQATSYWTSAIAQGGGIVSTIDTDLFLPDTVPVTAYNYKVSLLLDNTPALGRISLLVDKNGILVDSWIGISHLTGVALIGSFVCVFSECTLNAKTNGGLVGFDNSESVDLSGPDISSLQGSIKVNAQTSVNLTTIK